MKYPEQPYITPAGYTDYPFAYVFDGTGLTDTSDYTDIALQLSGDSQFVLRRILGVPLVVDTAANGGRFNYRNPGGSYANANPTSGIVFPKCWPVLPEKVYNFNDSIRFDVYAVNRTFTACSGTPIYLAYIAFMGVKRLPTDRGYILQQTPYKYREVKYSYSYSLLVDWNHFATGTSAAQPHRFSQQMEQYDFELQAIRISKVTSGDTGSGALVTNDFSITLYDPNMRQYSNLPLLQSWVNSARVTPAQGPPYQAVFPVPSVVYPAGGQITFDVTSLLCDAVGSPQTYNIYFDGVWRIPCNASR